MREYGLSLLVAAALTFLVMPVVRSLALRAGAVAGVRDRDVHDHAIPRWGGLGMFLGLCAGMLLASKLPMMRSVFEGASTEGVALLSGAAIIVALGLADDRWELDAPTKMAGQVLAAAVMALQGITLLWLPIDGVLVLDPTTSVLLTVLIVLVSVNAINFIDGLDGLAAGITAVSAAAFFVYAYLLSVQFGVERATLSALVSALLVGVCIGFLPHNVFPARLFMGDTGSMLIGYLMAASVITLTGKVDPNALEGTTLLPALLPILVPLAVLAVPLIDLGLAVIRRTRAGRSPFAPDKQHLHHRLLEMGHSQRRAVLLLTGWAALIAFSVVLLAFVPLRNALVASLIGACLLGPGCRLAEHAPVPSPIGGRMTDTPDAQPRDAGGPTALVTPMRRVLRIGLIASLVALPVAVLIGYLVAGAAGAWGAAIGMGIAVGFFTITVGVALGTAGMDATALGASVLGSWLIKMILLLVVLALLRDADFYSRPVLFIALLVGTIGTLVLEALVVTRTPVPYTESAP